MRIPPFALALVVAAPLASPPAAAQGSCSAATLDGPYVFSVSGFTTRHNQSAPNAISGLETYNGDGTMSGIYTAQIDGHVYRDVAYTGTYTVGADCKGTLTITETVSGVVQHFDQFVSPSGKEFTFVQTDPGFLASGFERRSD
jgi:hypothetical protein